MEEEGQELNEVIVGVAVLLLHTDDVGRVVRLGLLRLHLVEGEEAELEEVLDADCDLQEERKTECNDDGAMSQPIRNQHCNAEISFQIHSTYM